MRLALGLAALVAVLRLVGIAITPITDPSEARYSLISREMARDGDFITPRLIHKGEKQPFLGKPPLFFWAATASIAVFGECELAYRFPSYLAALLCALFLWSRIASLRGPEVGRMAFLVLLSSGGFLLLAGYALLDMVLTLFIAWGHLAILDILVRPERTPRASIELGIAAALGFLTKGPVALAMIGLPLLGMMARERSWAGLLRIHWWKTLGVALLISVPWFALAERAEPGFLKYFFVNENFLRYISPDYGDRYGSGHLFPHGSAIWMFAVVALPWSLVFLLRRPWRGRSTEVDRVQRFAYLGVLTIVGFLCFARQLLLTYLLPALPLFAIAVAIDVTRRSLRPQRYAIGAASFAVVCAIAIPIVFLATPGRRTTKAALTIMPEIISEKRPVESFCFPGGTPYSSYLYTEKPKIECRDSWRDRLAQDARRGTNSVYLLRPKRYHRLDSELLGQFKVLSEEGGYVAFATLRPKGSPPPSASRPR